ncbi:MAG TPA: NAD(P)(+) transhydrogenase (Re/Si-specific) subunit alpha [Galbitalea sp.]|nr:NAD(P)(+) transhydrogenase (Re/Si-specific) subunit alpha [Galbitalea sp.]
MPAAVTETVGVVRESAAGERRVALDPAAVASLTKLGRVVIVERGAGEAARFPDAQYEASGAKLGSRKEVLDKAGIVAVVRPPDAKLLAALRAKQTVVGLLDPLHNLPVVTDLAKRGITAVAFELLPRTVSRAQSMDALSSQASAAGYRAAIVAAESFARYLPMMITASGTATPAKVLVIGTGVAGLQAIATARRLGAVVTGYDVRAASRGEVESLGANFMTSSISEGAGAGGYARAMTAEERAEQQAELSAALKGFDIIITTAKVPGQAPPVLVSKEALATLRSGTVCVDLGSSELGGNVAGSVPDTTTVTTGGVTIIGAGELAAELPASSSQMYGRNVVSVLGSLFPQGILELDPDDEVHQNIVVTHDGDVRNAAVRAALKLDPLPTTEKVTNS